jgi:hypothetical protein
MWADKLKLAKELLDKEEAEFIRYPDKYHQKSFLAALWRFEELLKGPTNSRA